FEEGDEELVRRAFRCVCPILLRAAACEEERRLREECQFPEVLWTERKQTDSRSYTVVIRGDQGSVLEISLLIFSYDSHYKNSFQKSCGPNANRRTVADTLSLRDE
ncbi:hypothetical protein AVEN_120024-1, partial [Araneus ventricosus]